MNVNLNLNLRQIEIFRAVMTIGCIRGATVLLHVFQPAVSRLLVDAEAILGFRLFERIKGRLYATPEPKLLMREVENVYVGVHRFGELAAAEWRFTPKVFFVALRSPPPHGKIAQADKRPDGGTGNLWRDRFLPASPLQPSWRFADAVHWSPKAAQPAPALPAPPSPVL